MLGYTLAQPCPGCTCHSCAPKRPRYRRDGERLLSSALWSLFWVSFLISLANSLSYRCRGGSERSRVPRSGACRGRLGFGPCKCPCLGLDRGVPVPSHCAPPHGAQQGRRRSRLERLDSSHVSLQYTRTGAPSPLGLVRVGLGLLFAHAPYLLASPAEGQIVHPAHDNTDTVENI